MKRDLLRSLLCLVLVGAVGPPALADDVFPPPWRGEDRTNWAVWDSWQGWHDQMAPDLWESIPPLDPGLMPIARTNSADPPVFDGQTWVLRLDTDDRVHFPMPNYPDENEFKLARVQVTYANLGNPDQRPVLSVTGPDIEDVWGPWLVNCWEDDYITVAYEFEIYPNPGCETFHLSFDPFTPAYVDQVVIDTWCVPEPCSACLLAFGALAFIRRKRR